MHVWMRNGTQLLPRKTFPHAYIHTYICTCIHAHINTHTHTHVHTYIYTYTHTHAYTHTLEEDSLLEHYSQRALCLQKRPICT